MKRLFCMIIATVLLLSSAGIVSANETEAEAVIAAYSGTGFDFDFSEKSTERKAFFTSDITIDCLTMYAAAYKDNQLVDVRCTDIYDIAPGSFSVNTNIDWSSLEKDKVKLMVWDENARPYAVYEYDEFEAGDSYEVTGVITETPIMSYVKNGYDPEADKTVKVLTSADESLKFECSAIPDIDSYLGKKVSLMISDGSVCEISEIEWANTVTTIYCNQLVDEADKYFDEDGVIAFREEGDIRITTLDLDMEVTTIMNYGNEYWNVDTTADLAENLAWCSGTVEFISNDANSAIDYIVCTVYSDNETVVEDVYIDEDLICFDCYTGWIDEIDLTDEDLYTKVIRDGKPASVSDIQKGDTVSVLDIRDGNILIYHVSSVAVDGTVSSYDEYYVTIGEGEYRLSPYAPFWNTGDLAGITGKFFLNVCGEISFYEAVDESVYGVILALAQSSGINSGYEVEVVLEDGTVATYRLSSKVYIEDETSRNDDEVAEFISKYMDGDYYSYYRVNAGQIKNMVYKIITKNGNITKLSWLNPECEASGKVYDAESMTYGSVCFNEETIVVAVDASYSASVKADDVLVGKVSDFMVDGDGEDAEIYAFDEDKNGIAGLVVGTGLAITIPRENDAVVVKSIKEQEVDNDSAYEITGLQAGEEVTFTIYNEDACYTYDPYDIGVGDVILAMPVGSDGYVKDFEILYDYDLMGSELLAYDDFESKKPEYYFAGMLDKEELPTDRWFRIEGIDDVITMFSSANYTVVDFTESMSAPEIRKASNGRAVFGSLRVFDSEVFLRYYDDELKEVIVYRTISTGMDEEISRYEGVVTGTPLTEIAETGSYSADASYSITVQKAVRSKVFSGADAAYDNSILGKRVVAYYGADDNLLAVSETSSNETMVAERSQFVTEGENYEKADTVSFFEGLSEVVLPISEDAMVFYNYLPYDVSSVTTAFVKNLIGDGGKAEFTDNDGDGIIDSVLIISYASETVVKSVSYDDDKLSFGCFSGKLGSVDLSDDSILTLGDYGYGLEYVYDLKPYSTVSVANISADGGHRIFYVSEDIIHEADTECDVESNVVKLNGADYGISAKSFYESAIEFEGKEGTFFINADGKITLFLENEYIDGCAMILSVAETNTINKEYEIEVALENGEIAVYRLHRDASITGETGENAGEVAAYLKERMDVYGNVWRVNADMLEESVYRIDIKNEKVMKLSKLECESSYSGKEYDAENMAYGGLTFDKGTVIVSVNTEGTVNANDIEIGNVSDFFVDGEGEDGYLMSFAESNDAVSGFVVGFGIDRVIPRSGDALIVESVRTVVMNNDEAYVITGLQGGQNVSYTLYNKNGVYKGGGDSFGPGELNKGDVILTSVANAEGIIKDYRLIYSSKSKFIAADVDNGGVKDEVYFAGMLDKEIDVTDIRFYIEGADEAIIMKNSANYTLVDFSESIKNPEISKKTKGKSIFGSLPKYDSEVFVRYYDDELKEVVVYRTITEE